ncbi:MAG: hypothetical protein E7266_06360 [Lachnospiraceae bacterium]|nr:hypothetical protein [Lachnospiraceae bacterium]
MNENNNIVLNKKRKFNSFFDFGLFSEGIRQLRVAGFVSFLLINIIAVLIPLGQFVSVISTRKYAFDYDYSEGLFRDDLFKYTVEFPGDFIYMYLIFIIVAPLLTLVLFSFLNKRKTCDYYHAFPQKRSCIFISYTTAVLAWIFMITFGTALISSLVYLCLTPYIFISYGMLIKFTFSIFICALLVVSAVAFACSITGNLFSNIVTSLLILFFPRLLIFVITACVTQSYPLFVYGKLLPVFDATTNLLLASIFDARDAFYSLTSIGYTVLLLIAYFALACLCFVKRRSESAGYSANNRALQFIFRLCAGLPLSLIVVAAFYNMIIDSYTPDLEELFLIFVLEIICIVIMLLYELLSTRKLKYVLRSLITIPVFFIAQIVILFVAIGLFFAEFNYSPKAEHIDYIVIEDDDYDLDYYTATLGTLKIRNDEINEIVARSLDNTLQYYYKRLAGDEHISHSPNRVTLGIKSGLTVKYRSFYMSDVDYKRYNTLLTESEEISAIYSSLPEFDPLKMDIYGRDIDDEATRKVYDSLRSEIATLEPGEWLRIFNNQEFSFYIRLNAWVNNMDTYTWLPITGATPKTLMMYMNYSNDHIRQYYGFFNSLKNAVNKLNQIENSEPFEVDSYMAWFNESMSIEARLFSDDYSYYETYSYWDATDNVEYAKVYKEFYEAILKSSETPIDSLSKDGYVLIAYSIYNDSFYTDCEGYAYIPKELFEKMEEIKAAEDIYTKEYYDDLYY